MTPSYLLLEPRTGQAGEVLDALSQIPFVEATQELFESQKVAARIEADDDLDAAASELEGLDAVEWACLYGGDGADQARMPLHASG